jgi:hypothetical protein
MIMSDAWARSRVGNWGSLGRSIGLSRAGGGKSGGYEVRHLGTYYLPTSRFVQWRTMR